MAVILGAYTVYLDLWICDPNGRVIASGRPERYPQVAGASAAGASWFQQAMRTRVMLLDARNRVIACSRNEGVLSETYRLRTDGRSQGHYRDGDRLVAFHDTPGYETYGGLGWRGVIEQRSVEGGTNSLP
jgi:hypothetical protein